jgi:phosphoglycolate phosphatase-like HAD superfamily hydrolase
MIVFDLDGCLIDSEKMIRASYREAGVEPPGNFLSLGHHDWIDENREMVHARKNAVYLQRLTEGWFRPLPPWRTAEMLHKERHAVALLTMAPEGAVRVLAEYGARSWPFTAARSVSSLVAKTAWLRDFSGGVYVDDQQHVTMPTGWRFVHWTGQDADQLYAQVTR